MSVCRYSYLSGACANKNVDSLECIGEGNCDHSEMNILTKRASPLSSEVCGADRWLGLYCERYKRFFCPGKDKCGSHEVYMRHFMEHLDRAPKHPDEE